MRILASAALALTAYQEIARLLLRGAICVFCLLVPWTIAGSNVGWGLVLAGLVAFALCGGSVALPGHRSALEVPLWIYFLAAILTSALGVAPAHSLGLLNLDFHKIWIYTLFSVALATELAPQAPACLAAGFAAASLVGIGQVVSAVAQRGLAGGLWFRAHCLVHPVTFGEQTCIAALGVVCFLARPEGTLKAPWQRRTAWLMLALTAAALLLSQTRGAMVAFAAGLAAASWFVPRLRKPVGLTLLAALLLIPVIGRNRYEKPFREELLGSGSQKVAQVRGEPDRLPLWSAALSMGRDHFWTGVGPHNFRAVFPHYYTATFKDGTNSWGSAHNLYLQQFAERGAVGLCALLLLLGAFWLRSWQRAKQQADAWNLWALGTSTAFVVMNVTEVAFQTELLWMLVFFVWVRAEAGHREAMVRLPL